MAALSYNCTDYVVVDARGSGEAQGPSLLSYAKAINTTLANVPNGREYDVVYPASSNATARQGAADMIQYINDGIITCPQQQYVVVAYSLGTRVASFGLANLTSAYDHIVGVLVAGNEVRIPNSTANVDEKGGTSNRADPGRDWDRDGTVNFPNYFYDSGNLLDICYTNDRVCDRFSADQIDEIPHIQYPLSANVQKMASDFMISRLQAETNGTVSSNGTTSGNATTTGKPSPTSSSSSGSASSTASAPASTGSAGGQRSLSMAALFSSVLLISFAFVA